MSALSRQQPCTIRAATFPMDSSSVRVLFTAYAAALDIDLSFQSFETELATLPGAYSPPGGCLLLAHLNSTSNPVGCIAVRPIGEQSICEMKRLYVTPEGRGSGAGRALAEAAVAEARKLGYSAIRLDTLPSMGAAQALYKSLGFREIEAYCHNPIEGALFLELRLG